MDRFFGFDLGDAESAVSRLSKTEQKVPEILSVRDEKSFITAYARLRNGMILIGETACYTPEAVERKIRFKSRFLSDPDARRDVRTFAAGVLGELYKDGSLIRNEDTSVYVGCPAGWNRTAREEYREIFHETGYPPVRIVSESRAALVAACQSKHLQIGYDILSKPVLVVDIGSSTTDFAYVNGGKEVSLETAGEVALGGGLMDEILLKDAIENSPKPGELEKIFANNEPWRSYAEFAARKLKEKYYSDEDYWRNNVCVSTIMIHAGRRPVKLMIRMDENRARDLTEKKISKLDGQSFREVFVKSLKGVRDKISGPMPDLLFLTGGVSKLRAVKGWCADVFPEAVVITGVEPEFSVARGLSYCAKVDEDIREFRADIGRLSESSAVETIVREQIDSLYRSVVDALVDPLLKNAAVPVFERWRSGEIKRLSDIDHELELEIEQFLNSDQGRILLRKSVTAWLRPVASKLEEYTMPICIKYNVPYRALSLTSYLSLGDINIKVDAKDVFGMDQMTFLIDTIISLLIGFLCGGSGIALISSGIPGVIAGAVVSLLLLFLGKDKMQEAVLNADLPRAMRKLVSKNWLESRIDKISGSVSNDLYESLGREKNEEITEKLVTQISEEIEECLTKMADVVEIPLG